MPNDLKYTELLRENAALALADTPPFRVAVLSNITISTIKEILEYSLRSRGINAVVDIGDYDNIVQDSLKFRDYEAVFIFYECANLTDLLPFSLHAVDAERKVMLIEKAREEISRAFEVLTDSKLVLFNLLTALPFSLDSHHPTVLDQMCDEINQFCRSHAPRSVKFVDSNKVLARCSVRTAIDLRFFLSSRALYTYSFFRTYSEFVSPIVGLSAGQFKKVLVLDCDNTLWKGIVGEDGLQGIQMFTEIQSQLVQLAQRGVLICLCSKNNPEDVDQVLKEHPQMLLRDEHIVLKAVNWNDKAENIERISQTLNVGLDSFVFLDDSDFDLELVRQRLPAVTTHKVPSIYSDYLWLFQSVAGLFYRETDTQEDRVKVLQYKTEFARSEQRTQFDTLDSYLLSLQLSIRVAVNESKLAPRMAQLTQKTNQFNLTTRRMSESEVYAACAADDVLVAAVDVSDKFGDYGTTGLILVGQKANVAHIDNFLLSCRVLGRGVEFKAFDLVVDLLRSKGIKSVVGTFQPSQKNEQVKDLYLKLGFEPIASEGCCLRFQLDIDRYQSVGADYIGASYA